MRYAYLDKLTKDELKERLRQAHKALTQPKNAGNAGLREQIAVLEKKISERG